MPPSYPHLSGAEVVRALEKLGFSAVRQKGSHVVMRRGTLGCVVPLHREIKVGTLSGLLKQAGLTVDDLTQVI
jgi:predicted RNA binding protein YcfA (HicA-like mRNA interferase family)